MKNRHKERRNRNLTAQLKIRMAEINKIGQSRNLAKNRLRENPEYKFGDTVSGIYSIKTMANYNQVAHEFIKWAKKNGATNRQDLQEVISKYADDYLKYRESQNLSVSTLTRDRAALNKINSSSQKSTVQFKKRKLENITRSRIDRNKNNPNFNEKRNADLISLAKGTGGRRADLAKLKPSNFFEKNGRLYVRFKKSKGGKDRVCVVREEHRKSIQNRIDSTRPNERLFERINSNADIHSYRREYAQELYKDIIKDDLLHKDLTQLYGNRYEPNIKGNTYKTQGQDNFFCGNRDDLNIITNALGHNRLDVAVNHYLR